MMNYEKLEDAVVQLLKDNSAGKFTVAGYQKQSVSSGECAGDEKLLMCYWDESEFPKDAGGLCGPFQNDITLVLDFTVAMETEGDLTVLENPNATPAQRAVAIEASAGGDILVHKAMREFFRDVFQILMSAENIDLPIPGEVVSSRWVEKFKKGEILRQGSFAMLNGRSSYTCRMDEYVTGDTGTALTDIDTGIEHEGDPVVRAGVINKPTP